MSWVCLCGGGCYVVVVGVVMGCYGVGVVFLCVVIVVSVVGFCYHYDEVLIAK